MIQFLSASNFKTLKSVHLLALSSYHVLIGPNGSGKSTFLDVIEFVRDCLRMGPLGAVEKRVPDYRDLTYMREGGRITIALVLHLRKEALLYTLSIDSDPLRGVYIQQEELYRGKDGLRLLGKTKSGKDFYQRESGKYQDSFVFGLDKLALSLTPPDEGTYPTANAVKRYLTEGIRYFQLNSAAMRQPCPATRSTDLELDGTNLARVVGRIIQQDKSGAGPLQAWTAHLRYAIEDLQEIGWAKREADNAEYLTLKYLDGLVCPSWLLSDGTLRMMALTLPAFLPSNGPAIYMVEEPENGVHPKALEIIIKALAAIPNAQTFVATHSPLVVLERGVEALLCFTRDENGVHITAGKDHPVLKNWNGIPDLGSIFSSRVLG